MAFYGHSRPCTGYKRTMSLKSFTGGLAAWSLILRGSYEQGGIGLLATASLMVAIGLMTWKRRGLLQLPSRYRHDPCAQLCLDGRATRRPSRLQRTRSLSPTSSPFFAIRRSTLVDSFSRDPNCKCPAWHIVQNHRICPHSCMRTDTNGPQYFRSCADVDMPLEYRGAGFIASSNSDLLKDEAIHTDFCAGMNNYTVWMWN